MSDRVVFNTKVYDHARATVGNNNVIHLGPQCQDRDTKKKDGDEEKIKESVEETNCNATPIAQDSNQQPEDEGFTRPLCKGYVAVIANKTYAGADSASNDICDNIIVSLRTFFVRLFGFRLQVLPDLTAEKICEEVEELSEKDFRKYDSLFLIYLGHGRANFMLGVDNKKVSFEEIADMFTRGNCPSLVDKPKIFINQIYWEQGDETVKDGPKIAGRGDENAYFQKLPRDIHITKAMQPIGKNQVVPLFLETLTEVFHSHFENEHLLDLMLLASHRVKMSQAKLRLYEDGSKEEEMGLSEPVFSSGDLSKKYYFCKET